MIKYEHKIGTTKGTDVEKEVQNNLSTKRIVESVKNILLNDK